jgi:hypothetical protein
VQTEERREQTKHGQDAYAKLAQRRQFVYGAHDELRVGQREKRHVVTGYLGLVYHRDEYSHAEKAGEDKDRARVQMGHHRRRRRESLMRVPEAELTKLGCGSGPTSCQRP